jgi:hypothetical protein
VGGGGGGVAPNTVYAMAWALYTPKTGPAHDATFRA